MDLALRQLSSAPRALMWACLALAVAISSILLVDSAARDSGMGWAVLCRALPLDAGWPSLFAMWAAMALAMMLPTAAPMLSAYLDIAEAAREKSAEIVPPFVLAAGYAAVWLGFAAAAATSQLILAGIAPSFQSPSFAGGLLVLAGLYQFAPLKHACLTKCRRPMPYFMAHWTTAPLGVFKMGLHQGALCLGCCWALMALGLAAGFMNLAWMAGLTLVMVLEKTLPEPKPVIYGLGLGLLGAGVAMIGFGA
jgi:predicted metal-binding membrane protein